MELPRNSRGVRVDVRGQRDLAFSDWHRKNLPPKCYVTDIDFLEYRFDASGEIILKAILEVKEWHVTQPKYIEENANFKAIKKLCEILGLPFFVIWYDKDDRGEITKFRLWDVFHQRKDDAQIMSPEELKAYLKKL
jgi:hypothetical protein